MNGSRMLTKTTDSRSFRQPIAGMTISAVAAPVRARGPRTGVRMTILFLFYAFAAPLLIAADGGPTGPELFQGQCARCHGESGEGNPDFCPDPLHGDRPLADLTELIVDTMPEEDPEKCVGDDAKRVAEYIYETFYTAEARARNQPPRIALSRMTVRQYQNAAADLLAGFVGTDSRDEQRGVAGTLLQCERVPRQQAGDRTRGFGYRF